MYKLLMSEEEINKDLRRNFPLFHLKIDNLTSEDNYFLPRDRLEVQLRYACGRNLGDFLRNNGIRIGFSAYEILPLAFVCQNIYELSALVERPKVIKGYSELKEKLKIIGPEKEEGVPGRVLFYINGFDEIKENTIAYAIETSLDAEEQKLRRAFEGQLGQLRRPMNVISQLSKEIYEEFREDFKNHILIGNKVVSELRDWRKRKGRKSLIDILTSEALPALQVTYNR